MGASSQRASETCGDSLSCLAEVEVTGVDFGSLARDERDVILCEARYSQAMVDADLNAMRSLTSPDLVYTHMSGMRQTRGQYLADVESGRLSYNHVEIRKPSVRVSGNTASITFVAMLDARAYGAVGVFPMRVTHWFGRTGDGWKIVNPPQSER